MIKYILPVIALAFASSAYAHCGTCGVGEAAGDHKHEKAKTEAKASCCSKDGEKSKAACCAKDGEKSKAACCKDEKKCESCTVKGDDKKAEKAEAKKAEAAK